ncbi:hypothetical protein VII00023_07319 [Vibrio ichthyoenteri ATCC 700023]|uniref:DUF1496 domain-containing protein n=1 Tax=Vibrio ichthyoenteri ATCC 700023 TaxID=870968 RepID=F9RXT9_9VIBR|nr:DUF1496 domain-containing protein [Vibrio ichthyoenteri]EGU47470.1 hypothetical protein VII00023_07319 [Vibrio ichthyoenteri ATCC 700023]
MASNLKKTATPILYQVLLASLLCSLSTHQALANSDVKSFSPPKKAAIVVNASDLKHRICYYQDQAYSLGALLNVGEHIIRCVEANDFETNGQLKWVMLNKTAQSSDTP